jgi:hypothetical protein
MPRRQGRAAHSKSRAPAVATSAEPEQLASRSATASLASSSDARTKPTSDRGGEGEERAGRSRRNEGRGPGGRSPPQPPPQQAACSSVILPPAAIPKRRRILPRTSDFEQEGGPPSLRSVGTYPRHHESRPALPSTRARARALAPICVHRGLSRPRRRPQWRTYCADVVSDRGPDQA